MGYKGVEPAGFFNFTPKEFRQYVENLGMVVSSTHSPWVKPETLDEAVEVAGILGVQFVTTGGGAKDFESLDSIKRTAEITNGMHEKLRDAGLTLVVHNHAWEFETIDGRIKYEIFAELCPEVQFELDTYWASNFGANDAAEMMRRFAKRSPLLHIKDGPLTRPESRYNPVTDQLEVVPGSSSANVAVGSGKINVEAIIAAIDPGVTQWLVVEFDTCDTDMFAGVERSYRFLTEKGLASGNKK